MQNAVRRARVRIPERTCLLPEGWQPEFMDPANKHRDSQAVSRIQGYNHGELFGQVVASSGVTLNGQPVKLLVCQSRGQARDLLDHPEIVVRIGQFKRPNGKPPVYLDGLIKSLLAKRPVTVD